MSSLASFPDAQYLLDVGYAPIPLKPQSKEPLTRNWQRRDPRDLWAQVPATLNVGIRCGDGIAVIDCDDKARPGTFATIQRILAGQGHYPGGDYPLVQTASGCGRHIYVRLLDPPSGSVRLLQPEIGAGEFRYGSGAYVVAPPSSVGHVPYALLEGDWRQLPRLEWRDLAPFVGAQAERLSQEERTKRIPRNTLRLLQGQSDSRYASRSEYEQAILTGLANAGLEFAEVLDIFLRFRPSRFAQLHDSDPRRAVEYVEGSYRQAQEWASTHENPLRQSARAVAEWATAQPWPGRTGATDRAVLIAHAELAEQAGRKTYAASARDLAERAQVSWKTAATSTRRLCDLGFIVKVADATQEKAASYALTVEPDAGTEATRDASAPPEGQTYTLPHLPPVGECVSLSHDAFRYGGLNKSAGEVWLALKTQPGSIGELARRTGRNPKTVRRVLRCMERLLNETTGELVRMVRQEDGVWHALDVDLNQVAELIGTAGAGERQRQQHAAERRRHRRDLEKLRRQERPRRQDEQPQMPSARQQTHPKLPETSFSMPDTTPSETLP